MENHTKYSADSRWVCPFAPKVAEPTCHGTKRLIIKPNERVNTSSKTFTFDFPSTGEDYLNLESVNLLFKGTIKKNGNSSIGAADKVSVTNNFLHSV